MSNKTPICNRCKKKMFRVKDRKTGIVYWDCEKGCMFHYPVWKENLTKNEEKFLKGLK